MPLPFLPYGRQSIDDSDIEAVTAVLRSDWLTTGPAVDAFEAEFAACVGARHAIACSNGTTALHLSLAALDVGPGDVCIVPAITFMATANAVMYCGADVQFADVDAETGLMTAATLEQAISKCAPGQLRAVLPVHLAGQCDDMMAMRALASTAGTALVEDACHALGTSWQGEAIGACAHSDASCFSFHPVKTIAAGEGGMVTTNDDEMAIRLRRLRSHGIERDPSRLEQGQDEPWWHEMQELGWNYRLCDIQAALARSQLRRLPEFAARRRALAATYDRLLAGDDIIQPLMRTPDCDPCLHLYAVRIDFAAAGLDRATVMRDLQAKGIGSQVHYIPVPSQPWYRRKYGGQTPPGAAAYYQKTLSLPLFADMSDTDPERVVAALAEVVGR